MSILAIAVSLPALAVITTMSMGAGLWAAVALLTTFAMRGSAYLTIAFLAAAMLLTSLALVAA